MQTPYYDIRYPQSEYFSCYLSVIKEINTEETGLYQFSGESAFNFQDYLVCCAILLLGGNFRGGAEGCRMLGEKLGFQPSTIQKTLQKLQKIRLNLGKDGFPLLEKITKHKSKAFAEKYNYTPQPCRYRLADWFIKLYYDYEEAYKNYISGDSRYSPVQKIVYIPKVAKELGLKVSQYFMLFIHKIRYKGLNACWNKSDWARATGFCRQTIYNNLNELKQNRLIQKYVLDKKGSHRQEERFWIRLTGAFEEAYQGFFASLKTAKKVEKTWGTPPPETYSPPPPSLPVSEPIIPSSPASISSVLSKMKLGQKVSPSSQRKEETKEHENLSEREKEISSFMEETLKNTVDEEIPEVEIELPNIFQSRDAERSEVMQKMEKALQNRLNFDDLVWQYEAPKFAKVVGMIEVIPFAKLRIFNPKELVEEVYEQTSKELSMDEFWFVKHFKKNLLAKLESYLE